MGNKRYALVLSHVLERRQKTQPVIFGNSLREIAVEIRKWATDYPSEFLDGALVGSTDGQYLCLAHNPLGRNPNIWWVEYRFGPSHSEHMEATFDVAVAWFIIYALEYVVNDYHWPYEEATQ